MELKFNSETGALKMNLDNRNQPVPFAESNQNYQYLFDNYVVPRKHTYVKVVKNLIESVNQWGFFNERRFLSGGVILDETQHLVFTLVCDASASLKTSPLSQFGFIEDFKQKVCSSSPVAIGIHLPLFVDYLNRLKGCNSQLNSCMWSPQVRNIILPQLCFLGGKNLAAKVKATPLSEKMQFLKMEANNMINSMTSFIESISSQLEIYDLNQYEIKNDDVVIRFQHGKLAYIF